MRQDLNAGRGCFVIDPHGDLSDSLNQYAKATNKRIVLLDPSDGENELGYNPIRQVPLSLKPLLASGLLDVFKKQWGDSNGWGAKLEHILRNVLYTLTDIPDAKLSDIPKLLRDKSYRERYYHLLTNAHVRDFWRFEYDKYSKRYLIESIAPILNKMSGFITHPALDQFLNQPKRSLSLRHAMDQGKTVVINLSKGSIGEDAANLLGGLLITCIALSAYSRANIDPASRKAAFLIVDEFQNFTGKGFVSMSAELRKYGLGLVLATQHLNAVDPGIRSAILGNFGSLVSFRLGAEDAATLQNEFLPKSNPSDLMRLPNYTMMVRVLFEGKPSVPFSAKSLELDCPRYK